ncbi:tRNA 4-thiouridine(8) synthase ThiI [Paenibacillus rhizovicinus]|uniref:Probable tRNA sulfurtransferase n=1 Tax=Paenibacillus rhizovicinus TaxID=2704463 RepID=A0A6C0NW32_9BACL|nr:tRNA uracil 4-sulfurtransferase ThiI [Paenibacillus rhizovicinus]QHW30410.1 tRNA 4-thiouridine(8) synthase ThiI [Paenibacillus rhizovicinus]
MNPDMILIRFGEFTVKGKNRDRFDQRIMAKVKRAVSDFPRAEITRAYGRIYITLNGEPYEAMAVKLKSVFGIASFSPIRRTVNELEAIRSAALDVMRALPKQPDTFKVSVRRVDKGFPHDSQEMNHLVGGHVLRELPGLKVNVREPEVELKVEIQPEGTYVFSSVVQGAGGYPHGTNGKALLMLSGGIDSPVAGYLAMRQGLEIEAVHYHSYPFTSEQAKEKVIELVRILSQFTGSSIKLHLVSFTDIQTAIAQCDHNSLIITLMRRSMLRIAEQLAGQREALGIVTGDSLGQVASQTLSSMNVIGRTTELPLLRPLITMDKNEIIRIARQIGTFETSILPYEDCCTLFVPKNPTTNPNLGIVEKAEESISNLDEMILQAVATVETLTIRPDIRTAVETAGQDDWF